MRIDGAVSRARVWRGPVFGPSPERARYQPPQQGCRRRMITGRSAVDHSLSAFGVTLALRGDFHRGAFDLLEVVGGRRHERWLSRKSSVARLNVSGSSWSPACERCSKTTSSLPAIPLLSGSAKRVEQTRSRAPNVISVGASISPSAALASWVRTASVWATNEVHQRVDELRPLDVHLGREAPREDALDHDVRDGRQRRRERTS